MADTQKNAPSLLLSPSPLISPSAYSFTNVGYSDIDPEEQKACEASRTVDFTRVPFQRLFNIYATTEDILHNISTAFPALSIAKPYIIPEWSEAPTHWPSTNPYVDELWTSLGKGEAELDLGILPQGLTMKREHLIKPIGSPEAPLLVVSSYPTLDPTSSVHLDYSTVDDVSSACIFTLSAKFRYNKANINRSEIMHVDIFPRRLDRNSFVWVGSVLRCIPLILRNCWEIALLSDYRYR